MPLAGSTESAGGEPTIPLLLSGLKTDLQQLPINCDSHSISDRAMEPIQVSNDCTPSVLTRDSPTEG